jgi:hypothetical protein|nr:MAG TPA: hypothetical protein [Caudoviricetes sp.]
METKLLQWGVKYIVKVGRNRVAVRLIQQNADGNYLVRNLRTGKPFFVNSERNFVDFQNETERQKALDIIAAETAPIVSKESKSSNIESESQVPILSKDSKTSKVSKVSNDSKISKSPKVMGHSKCAFVKALGAHGYKYYEAQKVLDTLGISMPPASIKIQIYFGKKSDMWKKFGKPAELTPEQITEVEKLISDGKANNGR